MALGFKQFLIAAQPYAMVLIVGGSIVLYSRGTSVYPGGALDPVVLAGYAALGTGGLAWLLEYGYISNVL